MRKELKEGERIALESGRTWILDHGSGQILYGDYGAVADRNTGKKTLLVGFMDAGQRYINDGHHERGKGISFQALENCVIVTKPIDSSYGATIDVDFGMATDISIMRQTRFASEVIGYYLQQLLLRTDQRDEYNYSCVKTSTSAIANATGYTVETVSRNWKKMIQLKIVTGRKTQRLFYVDADTLREFLEAGEVAAA